MTKLARKRIRLAADQATRSVDKMKDVYTNATPELWRGNDVQFEVAIYHQGSIVADISNIASLTLEVKPLASRAGTPLMTKTVAAGSLDTVSQANWNDGTDQNALVVFSSAETNFAVEGNDDQLWLVISVITNDAPGRSITLQATQMKFSEDGTGEGGAPQQNAQLYYNKDETDARYMQLHADGASFQLVDGKHPYFYEATTDKWYPLVLTVIDGKVVFGPGAGETNP